MKVQSRRVIDLHGIAYIVVYHATKDESSGLFRNVDCIKFVHKLDYRANYMVRLE